MNLEYLNKSKTEMLNQLNNAKVTVFRLEGALALIEQLIKDYDKSSVEEKGMEGK